MADMKHRRINNEDILKLELKICIILHLTFIFNI